MKTTVIKGLAGIAFLAMAGTVLGQDNPDEYIGGILTDAAYFGTDSYGGAPYDLSGWSANWDQGTDSLTIEIYGQYIKTVMMGAPGTWTTLGDLFISTDGLVWNTTAETLTDNYFTGSSWEYAVRLGTYHNRGTHELSGITEATPSTGDLYKITDPDNQIILADDPSIIATGHWRSGQEVLVDPTATYAAGDIVTDAASWFIDGDKGMLSITLFNASSLLGVNYGDGVGFHWTQSCGNDVIEFVVVPEPSTVGILGGAGLMGLLFVRRRLGRKKTA